VIFNSFIKNGFMTHYILSISILLTSLGNMSIAPPQEGSCATVKAHKGFQKILTNPKYKCYGKPCSAYKSYKCPKYGDGCWGNYIQQEFCNQGKRTNLYFTDQECTCGCVDKNFHGKKLNILSIQPCQCGGNDKEIIGTDF
jgi:hypothetical protein